MKKKIVIFISIITALIGGVVAITLFESQTPPNVWKEIKPGMSISEVERILGSPPQDFAQKYKGVLLWQENRIFGNWYIIVTPTQESNNVSGVALTYREKF